MNNVLEVKNRTLNEVVNFMIKSGYKIIAKEDVLPIVLKTAERREQIAKITDSGTIKTVQFFLDELSKSK